MIALIPWCIILIRNIASDDENQMQLPVSTDILKVETTPPPITEMPEHTPAPVPTPKPEPTPEPLPEDKIISIASEYPTVSNRLGDVAKKFNCAAVSLVVYDGYTNEYHTFEFGFAELGEILWF